MVKKTSFLAGILVVIGLIGVIFTIPSMLKSSKVLEEKVIHNHDITNIAVETDNGVVELLPTDNKKISVEVTGNIPKNQKYNFNVDEKGNTVNIEFKEKGWKLINFNFFSKGIKIKVYVPNKTYERIQAGTNNGRVYATDLNADDILLSSDNGRIQLENVKGKTIEAESSNGRIELNNVTATSMNIQSDNGRIQLNDVDGNIKSSSKNGGITLKTNDIDHSIDLSSNNGKIVVQTKSEPQNATIVINTDNGKITIFGNSNQHTVYGEGKNKINLKSNNGNITVERGE